MVLIVVKLHLLIACYYYTRNYYFFKLFIHLILFVVSLLFRFFLFCPVTNSFELSLSWWRMVVYDSERFYNATLATSQFLLDLVWFGSVSDLHVHIQDLSLVVCHTTRTHLFYSQIIMQYFIDSCYSKESYMSIFFYLLIHAQHRYFLPQ